MKKGFLLTGVLCIAVLAGAVDCQAEKWVKKEFSSKGVEANYEDADSVKVKGKSLTWTEKYVLTPEGAKGYNAHLAKFKACKENLAKMGEVTYHQVDYEIENGKYRHLAKRNYNKKNEVVCTDKDMDKEFDLTWHRIGRKSPMEDTYYNLVTKYKLGEV
jgi:hypothetical protein